MSSYPHFHTALNTLPARFAQCVASPEDRDAASLTCVTATGAHLGRRSALIYHGDKIYPTLYSLIITQPSTLAAWYRWFRFLKDPPPVTNSGISKAEAIVHLVHDRVYRPDKVYTAKDAPPRWWDNTMVDGGVGEKRHLIMQRLGSELRSRTSAAARLRDTLEAVYLDGEMSAYVGYRDGRFHRAKSAHIALLVPEPDPRLAAAVCDQLPFLVARAEHAPVDVDLNDDSMLEDVLSDLIDATQEAVNEVTLTSDATRALQFDAGRKRQYVVRTLLRVAHILAVLERSPIVTETLLLQARAIVEASESTRASLHQGKRTLLRDDILEFVRAAGPEGLAHHELVRHIRRRGNPTAEIKIVLDQLAREQELVRTRAKTDGRDRVEWQASRVQ